MPVTHRRTAVAATVLSVLLGAGCGWVGSDSDTSVRGSGTGGPATTVPKPVAGRVVEGRPWRRGRRRRPRVVAPRWARSWSPRAAAVPGLDRRASRALARAWARAGAWEHASVGAFVDLAADLRALGAPDELVARCQAAADDERDHTARCLALASRYAGRTIRPGRVRGVPTREPAPPVTVLAIESLRDGIVNEGVAALVADEQRKLCTDADAAAALAVIADDEALHAALGWSILEWCIDVGGDDVRRAVAATSAGLGIPQPPAAPAGIPHAVAAAHGRGVPAAFAARVEAHHREVLGRLDALLAPQLVAVDVGFGRGASTPPISCTAWRPS